MTSNSQPHRPVNDGPSGPFFSDGSQSANPPRFQQQPQSLTRNETYGVTPSTLKTEDANGWAQEVISDIRDVRVDTPVAEKASTQNMSNNSNNHHYGPRIYEIAATVIASDGMDRKDGLPHIIGNAPPGDATAISEEPPINNSSTTTGNTTSSATAGLSSAVNSAGDPVSQVKETVSNALPNTREPSDPASDNQSAPFSRQGDTSAAPKTPFDQVRDTASGVPPNTREPSDPTQQNQTAPYAQQAGGASQAAGSVTETVGNVYNQVTNKVAQMYEAAAETAGDALDRITGDEPTEREGGERRRSHGIPTSAGPPKM